MQGGVIINREGFAYQKDLNALNARLTALEAEVAKLTADNSGMPKLPLMRFEVYAKLGCPIVEDEGVATQSYRKIVDDVYDLLEQQLSA